MKLGDSAQQKESITRASVAPRTTLRAHIQIASIGGECMMRRNSSEDEYGNLDKKK